jgi:hypothetical protein
MSRFDDNMMVDTPEATMGDGLVARCRAAAIAAIALADECVTALVAEHTAMNRVGDLDNFEEDPSLVNRVLVAGIGVQNRAFRRKDKNYPGSGIVTAAEMRPMGTLTGLFGVIEQDKARLRRYLRDDDWDAGALLLVEEIAAKLGGIKQKSASVTNHILHTIA